MKKTLFALLACATLVAPAMADYALPSVPSDPSFPEFSPAAADEAQSFENTFTLSADNSTTIGSAYDTQSSTGVEAVSISITSSAEVAPNTPDEAYAGLTADVADWMLYFSISNKTSGTVTLNALTLNVAAGATGSSNDLDIQFWLLCGSSYAVQHFTAKSDEINKESITFTLDKSNEGDEGIAPIVLNANETYDATLLVRSGDGPTSKGVSSIKVSGTTPEPATATLSLLALAGLAVRRRRH